jgi:hypothetical protein
MTIPVSVMLNLFQHLRQIPVFHRNDEVSGDFDCQQAYGAPREK